MPRAPKKFLGFYASAPIKVSPLTVTSVRTARQVINALNAEGSEIDIILAEVDLPIPKGLKMLKYIMRDKEFHRIPIIMMSSQDEVSIVVKCLRLGAADYLVKPLRTNELLNLWTHMWRRRRMLGLTEKNIFCYDFDVAKSDPSDANTNSTTIFSDDTDDKSRLGVIPELNPSDLLESESKASDLMEVALRDSSEYRIEVQRKKHGPEGILSCPKKTELKVGESSAFFTYIRTNGPTTVKAPSLGCMEENVGASKEVGNKEQNLDVERGGEKEPQEYGACRNSLSNGNIIEDHTVEGLRSSVPTTCPLGWNIPMEEHTYTQQLHQIKDVPQTDSLLVPSLTPLPFYLPQVMNETMTPPSVQICHGGLHNTQPAASSLLPQFTGSALANCAHIPLNVMRSLPYYHPVNLAHIGQMPGHPHQWPSSVAGSSSTDVKPDQVERRERALIKFRQKRKGRCFTKQIRYVSRKQLAERRPRVRGQFVRQEVNGGHLDMNRNSSVVDDSEEDEEEEEDASEF